MCLGDFKSTGNRSLRIFMDSNRCGNPQSSAVHCLHAKCLFQRLKGHNLLSQVASGTSYGVLIEKMLSLTIQGF